MASQLPPNWSALKQMVLDRDSRRCRKCGRRGNQVHHIKPLSRGGTNHLSNLVTLCTRCHAEQHPHLHRAIYGTAKLQG